MVPGIGIAAAGLVMFFLLAPSPEAAGFQPEEVVDVVVVDVVDVVDVVVVVDVDVDADVGLCGLTRSIVWF